MGLISVTPAPPTGAAAEWSLTPSLGGLTAASRVTSSRLFSCRILFSPHPNPKGQGPLLIPVLQMQELSPQEARRWLPGVSRPGSSAGVRLCLQGVPAGANLPPPRFITCQNPVSLPAAARRRPEALGPEGWSGSNSLFDGTIPRYLSSLPTLRGRHLCPHCRDGETAAQEAQGAQGAEATWH